MVSAWTDDNNLVLGQVKVSEKSNEITAIPELLKVLSIENTVVTIDAMGCQTEIARAIVNKNADYILAVKDNQSQLLEHIEDEFRFGKAIGSDLSEELDHGRIETRTCSAIKNFKFIEKDNIWKSLTSVIKIESKREFKNPEKPAQYAIRYYISSIKASPPRFPKSHWFSLVHRKQVTLDFGCCFFRRCL